MVRIGKKSLFLDNSKPILCLNVDIYTLVCSNSFQCPLFDLRHPPLLEQEQTPPRKSGSSLKCNLKLN
jgi:hypothetical protein